MTYWIVCNFATRQPQQIWWKFTFWWNECNIMFIKQKNHIKLRTLSNNFANLSWYGSNNYQHYKIYSVLNHIDTFDIKPMCHRFLLTSVTMLICNLYFIDRFVC
jgi:hypothetical protein